VNKSTPKRYTQLQLTRIFVQQSDIPIGETSDYQRLWWVNPTDPQSLRLSLAGLQFVKANLKLQSYEFVLPEELNNHHLLQLERLFPDMYYLLKRQKIILFTESEASMLTLYGNNLAQYLAALEG
jgi:hypothetical protein